MVSDVKKLERAYLEQKLQEENRKIKKYQLLLKGAEDRRKEIERKMREL